MWNARTKLRGLAMLLVVLCLPPSARAARPNVLLILTDDQGYGDLGCNGNSVVQTPRLDQLSREGMRFTQFYVEPVCTPTRASLMTGRYHFRTRAFDTIRGRAMMDPAEVTIAETFRAVGYQTAMFGKWHLGDCYPMRPMDQGFEQTVVVHGGGIADGSDFPGNKYLNPMLVHNGTPEQFEGYCTDVFTNQAIQFLKGSHDRPFFIYFATNVPHDPLQIPDQWVKPFEGKGLTPETPRVYGMLKNLDENLTRLLATLDDLKLSDNTIVLFMSDNGPAMKLSEHDLRYNAGLRGEKKEVYEGGIRTPLFVRWPGKIVAGGQCDRIGHIIDIYPTLCDACGISRPSDVKLDGVSFLPLLLGKSGDWPDRVIHFQWHRGDRPELYNNCASRNQQFKLVNGKELYEPAVDLAEEHDIAAQHSDVVATLRREYEAWFADTTATRGFEPPSIIIGDEHCNPCLLMPQDARDNVEDPKLPPYWNVQIARSGKYAFRVRSVERQHAPAKVHLRIGGARQDAEFVEGQLEYSFTMDSLDEGKAQLSAWTDGAGAPECAREVTIEFVKQ